MNVFVYCVVTIFLVNSSLTLNDLGCVAVVRFCSAKEELHPGNLLLFDIHISLGSVATHKRCGGIFSDIFSTVSLWIVTVREF